VGYTFKTASSFVRDVHVGLQFDNIFNRKSIDGLHGFAADASKTPLYWPMPDRALFGTVQMDF
jgi:iron complex outermembrane receptor protein